MYTHSVTIACMQAVELQHRAAVRARAHNAHLNALSDDDDAPYATAPTTDAHTGGDPAATHRREKGEKSKHKEKKSRKRDRKGSCLLYTSDAADE